MAERGGEAGGAVGQADDVAGRLGVAAALLDDLDHDVRAGARAVVDAHQERGLLVYREE